MANRERKASKDQAPRDPRWSGEQFWYKRGLDKPIHDQVVTYGKSLRSLYASAHKIDRIHERLYEGTDLRRYGRAVRTLQQVGFGIARLNVSKSVVNTVTSRLSKDRPMPAFKVDDADWSLKRRSKRFRKFIVGEMMETEFDARSKEALRDGAVLGNGITRIDDSGDGEKVFCERVLREELLFDPRECKHGKPPSAMFIHRIARARLAELYPAFAGQIFDAPPAYAVNDDLDDDTTKSQDLEDYVDVFEPWSLRGKRHALCIENATLTYEEWEEPRLPFAMFRYAKPMRGVWAKGLIYELKDIQHRINCIVRDMQMNLTATGRGHFAMQEGNALPPEMLTGWAPFVLKYKGQQPPTWNAPTPINPAQLQMLQFFIQQAFELPGVSQTAATSKSSLGPGASGVALDTQYDIDSERFAVEQGQYAEYRMESAQLYLDASKRVARKRAAKKGGDKYVSGWMGKDAIEKLEYDKVSLQDDQFKLQLEAQNYIPDTKSGKLSAVGQLAQAGVIPQWLVAALFDEPDLARANRIQLAAFWNCERKMELLADPDAEMPAPAGHNDLELELKMSIAYTNNAEAENAPGEVVERYMAYTRAVQDLLDKKKQGDAMNAPPAQPGAMPGGAGPGVVPGVGQSVPPMSGGAMPPEMAAPLAA